MEFNTFTEIIRDRLREEYGEGYKVDITTTLKNNSVKLTGVMISEKGCNVAPTIYLEEHYTDFCDGKEIKDIVCDIMRVYRENRTLTNIDTQMITDYGRIRERITYKLINREKNEEFLRSVPHRSFLDLAVVYYVTLGKTRSGEASFTVRNEQAEKWKVNENDLWEEAKVNTPGLKKAEIISLFDFICDITGTDPECNDCSNDLYVLTNTDRSNGASCILYDDLIADFAAKKECDVFIIPSSVHEVLLLPDPGDVDPKRLTGIIYDVNCTQVTEQEILSYSLYKYSRSENAIAEVS